MGIDSIRNNKKVINLAKKIKQNEHSIREVALVFFILALFAGLVWLTGKDVEPITYVLGSICTLLYVSPSLARYVLPDRKLVRYMSYDEILDFIALSDAKHDWKWIETSWAEEAFLKEDPRLRIRVRYDDFGIHNKDYTETWMAAFADTSASSYWFDLSYDGALIDRFILVSVDDGKAEMPTPVAGTLEIDPLDYKVAQIFDQHDTLDEYLDRAGLTVKKTNEPTAGGQV